MFATIAEATNVPSLDLMEPYHSVYMSSFQRSSLITSSTIYQSFGVLNKDCTEAVCLYSSQSECLTGDTVLQNWEGTGVHRELPFINYQHYSLQLLPLLEPSAQNKTMNICCCPLRLKVLSLCLLTRRSLVLKGTKLSNNWWQILNRTSHTYLIAGWHYSNSQ